MIVKNIAIRAILPLKGFFCNVYTLEDAIFGKYVAAELKRRHLFRQYCAAVSIMVEWEKRE